MQDVVVVVTGRELQMSKLHLIDPSLPNSCGDLGRSARAESLGGSLIHAVLTHKFGYRYPNVLVL